MTSRAPVVGIVGGGYVVARHWGGLPVTGTPRTYVAAVAAAGGTPVVLPLDGSVAALDLLDAVVLAGGGDVDPARYGGDASGAVDVDPDRDRAELAVVRDSARRRLPVLGVCRGLQVLAVAFGGRLTDLGRSHVLPDAGHRVDLAPGSALAGLLGTSSAVSSLHHQALDPPGLPWEVTGRTADGVVEACEWAGPEPWPALGVQWHPELDHTGAALFGWLVRAATSRREAAPR